MQVSYISNFKQIEHFLFKIVSYVLIILIPCILLGYYADPYNVFHPYNITGANTDKADNYIKTKYIIDNPNKFNTYILGSSRVGNIHVEKIENERCYNMTMSAVTPIENYDTILEMINGNVNIERIYLGLDSRSYTTDYTDHNNQPLYASYHYAKENPFDFFKIYINPIINVKSLFGTTGKTTKVINNNVYFEYGWNVDYNYVSTYDFAYAEPEMGSKYFYKENILAIKRIKELCDDNDIELIVFTNPMYYITYEASLDMNYINFLKDLAEITPYYNFSGYNDITTDCNYYIDTSHYTAEASDLIIDRIWKNKIDIELENQGFGYYVTSDNISELISILESQKK